MERTSRAFTLIELMIVLSIIGILAGIIISPSPNAIGKARDARLKEILSNLRLAVKNYWVVEGKYPESLKRLVPDYIKKIPNYWRGSRYNNGTFYYNRKTGEVKLADQYGKIGTLPEDILGMDYDDY